MIENTQFGPIYTLTIFREDGTGVEIRSPAYIAFSISLDRLSQPNEASITLCNLNDEMRASIGNNEFALVRLEFGYEQANNVAIIFEGRIRRAIASQISNDGILTRIVAGEGELAFRRATIEHSFAQGTTLTEMARFVISQVDGITEGDLSGLDGQQLGSQWVAMGSIRKLFDDMSEQTNSRWSIQRTSLDFVSNDIASDLFPVTRKTFETGLIDASLDENGIDAVFLLDPAIKPNGTLEIVSNSASTTGFWRIDSVVHEGEFGSGSSFRTTITGQRRDGVGRVAGQDERATFAS